MRPLPDGGNLNAVCEKSRPTEEDVKFEMTWHDFGSRVTSRAALVLFCFFWRSPWQEICGSDIWPWLNICAGVLWSRISSITEAI